MLHFKLIDMDGTIIPFAAPVSSDFLRLEPWFNFNFPQPKQGQNKTPHTHISVYFISASLCARVIVPHY